jgi:hypothetical protein
MRHGLGRKLGIVIGVLALASTAIAEEKFDNDSDGGVEIQKACNLSGYKSETQKFDPAVSIPDNNLSGVTLGPLTLPDDGTTIADVVIELKATHTYVGDLKITVRYDLECDGTTDAQAVLLCRPRGTQSTTPAPCGTGTSFGCSGNLSCSKSYKFDDTGSGYLAEGSCPSTVSSGCYKPAAVGGSPLSAFAGLTKNGCWYMDIVDHAAADVGTVCEWTVSQLNHMTVGVEAQPWSRVKTLFK